MFRKYRLILSTVSLLIGGDQAHMPGIVCGTFVICREAAGTINCFTTGDTAYAKDPWVALASVVTTMSIVAFCPATPLGALLGGALIFLSGVGIELVKEWSLDNANKIFVRHANKAIGVGIYIFLSSVPFGTNIAFLATILYMVLIVLSNHSRLIPEFSGIMLRLFIDTISIRWISGHYTFELYVITKLMLFVLTILLASEAFYHPKTMPILCLIASSILVILSLFIGLNFWFLCLIITLFQIISWNEIKDKFGIYQGLARA